MWYEFLLEGLKKFSGEIIGLILLAVFWRMFPGLRNWFKTLKKDDAADADVRQALEQEKAIKHAAAMSDKYFLKLCAFGDALEIDGFTALMYVAYYGRMEIAELLIKHGANVKAKNKYGWTGLMLAEKNDHTETAKLLRKYGAN